jgi:hypothetical protein
MNQKRTHQTSLRRGEFDEMRYARAIMFNAMCHLDLHHRMLRFLYRRNVLCFFLACQGQF